MAATELTMPLYMRVGNGAEMAIGEITLDLETEETVIEKGGIGRQELAGMLREAADHLDPPGDGDG